jgi:DNA-binding NarL/FixJ family response regulator
LADAIALVGAMRPELVLLDAAFPGGAQTAMRLCSAAPEADVIVLGVYEIEENVLAWAEVCVAGYVPNNSRDHE